jgi:hypothetical protein
VSIRYILALAAIEDMEIHQMDVKTAFLNGDLEKEIHHRVCIHDAPCGATSWSSKRQPIIVLSTMEAEYMASTQAAKEAIWMTKFMKELGYMKKKKAMVIRCDN